MQKIRYHSVLILNVFISAFVRPICLPYEDVIEEDYHSSDAMKSHAFWVAGWGATTKRGLK